MTKACVNCSRTEDEAPLLSFTFKGEAYFICPTCLPTLIHEPHLLAEKLPGIADLPHHDQQD